MEVIEKLDVMDKNEQQIQKSATQIYPKTDKKPSYTTKKFFVVQCNLRSTYACMR